MKDADGGLDTSYNIQVPIDVEGQVIVGNDVVSDMPLLIVTHAKLDLHNQ